MAQGVCPPPSLGWGCPCPQEGDGSKVTVAVSPQEPSLYTVKAVIILDNDGDRLFAKVRGGGGVMVTRRVQGWGHCPRKMGGQGGTGVGTLGGTGRAGTRYRTGTRRPRGAPWGGAWHGQGDVWWHRAGMGAWGQRWWPRVGLGGAPGDLGGLAQVPTCHCPCSTTMTRTPAPRSRKPLRRTSSTRPTAPTVRVLGTGTCVSPGRGWGGGGCHPRGDSGAVRGVTPGCPRRRDRAARGTDRRLQEQH